MTDNRIFPFLDKAQLSDKMQQAFERSLSRRGEARLVSAMGHAPGLFDWYVNEFYEKLFYGGQAPVVYKELGRLRLSEVHGCRSCNRGNRIDAAAHGLPEDKVQAIHTAGHKAFDSADRAVIQLADLMSLHARGESLTQDVYDNLRIHFDEGQILEMSMVFAILAGMAHFLFAFDMVEKEETCQL